MQEVLFFALLLCTTHAGRVKDLEAWQNKARIDLFAATELKEQWKPTAELWPPVNNVSSIFTPLIDAIEKISWQREDLSKVALAMQAWRGDGHYDNLTGQHLATYLSRPPPSPKLPKRPGPWRYKTWAVVRVAEFLYKHGPKLRKLLKLDAESEEAKPLAQVVVEQAEQIDELEEKLEETKEALVTKAAAHRQAAARLKKKSKSVSEARREERAKAKAAAKEAADAELQQRIAEAIERAAAKAAAKAKEEEVKTAKARARARAVESRAKKCGAALKRAREAEAERDELRDELDEAEAERDELRDELDEAIEAAGAARPDSPSLAAPQAAGRDAKGKFAALDWRMRELILAQEARRTPPTAIAANITDVMQMFASEKVVPLPCVKEMGRMRHELTVAGECLAAFRVALCKRIISFGFDESTKFGLGLLSSSTQIEPHDEPGSSVDVVLRGASLTAGGSSEEVAKSVDDKIFSHARRLLAGWKAEHEELFGKGSWRRMAGPTRRRSACTAWPRRR